MRITILTQGSRGDVQPYVALGVGLQRAGYEVCVPGPEVFRELVTGAGLDFCPVFGFSPQELVKRPELLAAARSGSQVRLLLALLRHSGPLMEAVFEGYWQASEGADAIIASTMVFGMLDMAEKRSLPAIAAPLHALHPTRAFPAPFFAPFGAVERHPANRFTHLLMEQILWQMMKPPLNRWRRKQGLQPIGDYYRWLKERAIPSIYGFSPSLLATPTDWPPDCTVTGFWFLDEAPGWQAPPALVEFIEAGPPPVYIGFGSMDAQDPERITRLAVEALETSKQRGVLGSGWAGLGRGKLPQTVFPIESLPHSWLFPKMKAVVHHGGIGTTSAGLRAGVPGVIVPFAGDQAYWADRVARLGAGIHSASYFKVTAERLAADITRAVSDPTVRVGAARLRDKIRAENGVEKAVNLIRSYFG